MASASELKRFKEAQAPVYDQVLSELEKGRKRSHWMWFIFPQMRGLGQSPMAHRYAVYSMHEAKAYLADDLLRERLETCTRLVIQANAESISDIFEYPDDLKFHSCMTLFAEASGPEQKKLFDQALAHYFDGQLDPQTLFLLGRTEAAKPA